jgi:RNA polymerase sigma factor (sigma-70 family)
MASVEPRAVLKEVRTIFGAGTVAGLTDAQLLERFAARRDESAELAFEALVVRHGPMVLAVCRDQLRNPHDADDAFQATFLVLVRKAGTVWAKGSLAGWLSSVAYRVAGRARTNVSRRRDRERSAVEDVATARSDVEPRTELHEELERLPEKYRVPIVLCYLEGRTHDEAAQELDWPVGTVRSRLARARDLLRTRLARRGLAGATLALALSGDLAASGAVPSDLLERTVQAAMSISGHGKITAGLVSASVIALTEGVLRTMLLSKIKIAVIAAVVLGVFAGSATVLARQNREQTDAVVPSAATAQSRGEGRADRKVDEPIPTRPDGARVANPRTRADAAAADDRRTTSADSPYELEVRLKAAQRRVKRVEGLAKVSGISQAEVEAAREELDLLNAQVRSQRDELEDEVEILHVRLQERQAEMDAVQLRRELAEVEVKRADKEKQDGIGSQGAASAALAEARIQAADLPIKRAQVKEAEIRLQQGKRRLERFEALASQLETQKDGANAAAVPR